MQSAAQLAPLSVEDFADVEAVAKAIWREHYTKLLSEAQVEYMLIGRYSKHDLAPYVGARERWFDLLRVNGAISGFLRCLVENSNELKLSEIYVAKGHRGQGLGQLLLARADARAAECGCRSIVLYVNRANAEAIKAYNRAGYLVVRECDFDIGHGYYMNDYLMEKSLPAGTGTTGARTW